VTDKAYTLGTHRAVAPEETMGRLGPQLARFGITRLADITGLDRIGIPVVAAYRPDARSLAVSMGKGVTLAAARASAAMESIELWHAERPILPLLWGEARAVGRDNRLLDWSGLPRTPGTQFEAATPTAWLPGVSLSDGGPLLVPYESVHTDGRCPEPQGSGWFVSTSNGLASGNTTVEAQVHALCEVIERDAVTLWRLAGDADATSIDLDSISDPACRDLLRRVEAADLAALLHDATSDIGVAVVHCTLLERGSAPDLSLYTTSGMGCHPSRAVAASRAITEAAQSRLTLISGARDDVARARYEQFATPTGRLTARASQSRRPFVAVPDCSTPTLEGDFAAVLSALNRRGLEPCWVDLAQPEVGLAVGRILVPGLELLNDVEHYQPGARARALIDAKAA
jgi:YcaO-like protein with predicted kinase domain